MNLTVLIFRGKIPRWIGSPVPTSFLLSTTTGRVLWTFAATDRLLFVFETVNFTSGSNYDLLRVVSPKIEFLLKVESSMIA